MGRKSIVDSVGKQSTRINFPSRQQMTCVIQFLICISKGAKEKQGKERSPSPTGLLIFSVGRGVAR